MLTRAQTSPSAKLHVLKEGAQFSLVMWHILCIQAGSLLAVHPFSNYFYRCRVFGDMAEYSIFSLSLTLMCSLFGQRNTPQAGARRLTKDNHGIVFSVDGRTLFAVQFLHNVLGCRIVASSHCSCSLLSVARRMTLSPVTAMVLLLSSHVSLHHQIIRDRLFIQRVSLIPPTAC